MQGILEATGAIDRHFAPAFTKALRAAIDATDQPAVFVDCAGVTFMDRTAFRAFADAHRYASERGPLLVICNLRPEHARAMRRCDKRHQLSIQTIARGLAAGAFHAAGPFSGESASSAIRPFMRP